MAYIETRAECLCKITDPISTENGNEVTDVMRCFRGDSPATQYEIGQKKGGNFHCPVCGADEHRVYDMEYCLRSKYISLAARQQVVLQGLFAKRGQWKETTRLLQNYQNKSLSENFRPEKSMQAIVETNGRTA